MPPLTTWTSDILIVNKEMPINLSACRRTVRADLYNIPNYDELQTIQEIENEPTVPSTNFNSGLEKLRLSGLRVLGPFFSHFVLFIKMKQLHNVTDTFLIVSY